MEGNTFLDFVNWAGVFGALRDSFHRNADFVFEIDQFVFQDDVFAAAHLIKFSFVFIRLFVNPFGLFKAVEFGFKFMFEWFVFSFEFIRLFVSPFFVVFAFEWCIFRIEFSFEWFVFAVVLFVFGFGFEIFAPEVFHVRSFGFQGCEEIGGWDVMDVCVFFGGSDCDVDALFVDRINSDNSTDFLFRIADHDLGDIGLFIEMMFQQVENFVGIVLNEKRNVVVIDVDMVFV